MLSIVEIQKSIGQAMEKGYTYLSETPFESCPKCEQSMEILETADSEHKYCPFCTNYWKLE